MYSLSASGRLVQNSICTNQSLAIEACNILDVTIPCLRISTPPQSPQCPLTGSNHFIVKIWGHNGPDSEPVQNETWDEHPPGLIFKMAAHKMPTTCQNVAKRLSVDDFILFSK